MNERKVDTASNDIFVDVVNKCVSRTSSFVDSTAQKIKTFVQTFVGECFTDRDAGVEWYDRILGTDTLSVDAARTELREKILSIAEVASVKDISITIDGRNTKYEYTVVLNDGTEIKDVV